jgi:hypothetical protein
LFTVLVTSRAKWNSCQCSDKPVTALRRGRYDKSLHFLYTLTPNWRCHLHDPAILFPGTDRSRPLDMRLRIWTFGSIKSGDFMNWWATTSFLRTLIHGSWSWMCHQLQRLVPAQSRWYLLSTKWYWDRLFFQRFSFALSTSFHKRPYSSLCLPQGSSVLVWLHHEKIVKTDSQQRHCREVRTVYQLYPMKCHETFVFIIVSVTRLWLTWIAQFVHTHL